MKLPEWSKMPEPHPVAAALPLMGRWAFINLIESICMMGQQQPCVTWRGKLLDGRSRWLACEIAEVKPKTRDVSHLSEEEAVKLITGSNIYILREQQLTESQKATIAAEVAPWWPAGAEEETGN